MHYLVVGKVKDYPDFDKFTFGLSRHTYIYGDCDTEYGKWKNITNEFLIYWRRSTILFHYMMQMYSQILNTYDTGKLSPSEEEFDAIQANCIRDHGFWTRGGQVYAKVSGHFDYIVPGGRYDLGEDIKTAKYKDVIAKFGPVDVFVLPDFECRFTKHKGVECPYKDDDEVWVLDGYTFCKW